MPAGSSGAIPAVAPLVLTASNGKAVATVRVGLSRPGETGALGKLWRADLPHMPSTVADRFTISVSGHRLEIPLGAVMDLYEAHSASLRVEGTGFMLDLQGGDGEYGYDAHIRFSRHRVQERTIETFGLVSERTVYKPIAIE